MKGSKNIKYHTDLTTEHLKHHKKRMGGKWIDSKHARGNGSFPGSCRLAYEDEYRKRRELAGEIPLSHAALWQRQCISSTRAIRDFGPHS